MKSSLVLLSAIAGSAHVVQALGVPGQSAEMNVTKRDSCGMQVNFYSDGGCQNYVTSTQWWDPDLAECWDWSYSGIYSYLASDNWCPDGTLAATACPTYDCVADTLGSCGAPVSSNRLGECTYNPVGYVGSIAWTQVGSGASTCKRDDGIEARDCY